MVARHVGREILPHAFDAVRIGTVRRQEVKDDAATELSKPGLSAEWMP